VRLDYRKHLVSYHLGSHSWKIGVWSVLLEVMRLEHCWSWNVRFSSASHRGEFQDQGDAKWIVIRGQLWGHNPTPFRRPTPGRSIGCPVVGHPQGIFGGLCYYQLIRGVQKWQPVEVRKWKTHLAKILEICK
jgi:hypothetical protein